MDFNKVYCGKMELVLKNCPDNFCDSIVTDPPYGLSFMGKHWDYDVPTVEQWKEAYRVLKPGGFLLAFGGTRTYHRMVVNIEDAGFEIRDQIQWLYGSGFPKSLDVSKAIDKELGVERIITGTKETGADKPNGKAQFQLSKNTFTDENGKTVFATTASATAEGKEWEGWGTALKPAHEDICLARKPFNTVPFDDNLVSLYSKLFEEICQLQSFAKIAENRLPLSLNELKEALNTAQWIAENNINIQAVSYVLMDTLRLESEINMNWSIVLSWLHILDGLYSQQNTFTTSTKSNLITELEILNSLEWESIFQYFIHHNDKAINGRPASALHAESLFTVLHLKLNAIQKHSAQEPAILRESETGSHSNPICVARKPVEGTVAANVLKYGTGGINIDGCRIGTEVLPEQQAGQSRIGTFERKDMITPERIGRFPANVILDEFMGQQLDLQSGNVLGGRNPTQATSIFGSEVNDRIQVKRECDEGGASRFFYCPKPDNFQRNKGLKDFAKGEPPASARSKPAEGRENALGRPRANHHPTVKPIDLMRYLVRMVTRKGGIVLDPFCGSGTTLVAAKMELMNYIGIDMDETHIPLAEARVAAWNPDLYKPQTLF